MRELMARPVVEAGVLMPDTCPLGSGIATIPVGGAVAVKNAIVPAAHSSTFVALSTPPFSSRTNL